MKRNFYKYLPDANKYQGVEFGLAGDEISRLRNAGAILRSDWNPVPCEVLAVELPTGDFPSLSNYQRIPILSKTAWDVVKPLIGGDGDALPVAHPSGEYVMLHLPTELDALNVERSEVRRSQVDGRVSRIFRYCFDYDVVSNHHVFRLPIECGGETIVDDDFRRCVEENNLVGLRFEPLEQILACEPA